MTEYSEPKLRRMLSSLPRSRMVVVISYGYIGRSQRQASTANASGLDTARFVMLTSGIDYSTQSIRNGVLCPECCAENRSAARQTGKARKKIVCTGVVVGAGPNSRSRRAAA